MSDFSSKKDGLFQPVVNCRPVVGNVYLYRGVATLVLPMVVGVGIGGTFDKAAYLAKKALIRPVNTSNKDEFYKDLEEELLTKGEYELLIKKLDEDINKVLDKGGLMWKKEK